MAIHDGHRDRMRKRIAVSGIENLAEHEILEYMLYSCIPRKDTNPIAHTLITTFGSLANVFDADIERLEEIEGMTYNAALFLHAQTGIFREYSKSKASAKAEIKNVADAKEYLINKLGSLVKEEAHLICKDSAGKIIKDVTLGKGTINQSNIFMREIVDTALKHKAVSVILAHNHPSRICVPSDADIDITHRVAIALAATNIHLDDHFIVAGEEVLSLKSAGYFDAIEDGKINLLISRGVIKDIKF